jgi:hypothetical protein
MEHEMNHANIDFLLDVLAFVVPLAIALGAAMLGSYLVFTLPAWLKRRARRRAAMRDPLPESSHAAVSALPAADLDRRQAQSGAHDEHADRRTA